MRIHFSAFFSMFARFWVVLRPFPASTFVLLSFWLKNSPPFAFPVSFYQHENQFISNEHKEKWTQRKRKTILINFVFVFHFTSTQLIATTSMTMPLYFTPPKCLQCSFFFLATNALCFTFAIYSSPTSCSMSEHSIRQWQFSTDQYRIFKIMSIDRYSNSSSNNDNANEGVNERLLLLCMYVCLCLNCQGNFSVSFAICVSQVFSNSFSLFISFFAFIAFHSTSMSLIPLHFS